MNISNLLHQILNSTQSIHSEHIFLQTLMNPNNVNVWKYVYCKFGNIESENMCLSVCIIDN